MIVQPMPYPAQAALVDDYFANIGATTPFGSQAVFPTALYDSSENITWIAYEAWSENVRIERITPYNHATGLYGEHRRIGVNTLTDDSHGTPSITKDHEGYLHAVFGSHDTPPTYSSTRTAITGGLNPQWVRRGAFVANYTYPHLHAVGSNLFLLMRVDTVTTRRKLVLTKTTALSAGVPTWAAASEIVDYGADSRFYIGNTWVVGTDIHIVSTMAAAADTARKGVYYYVYDTTTGSVSNFDGTTTVTSGSLPISLATANSDFRIVDHGSNRGDIPALSFDSSGNPHIVYVDGTGTSFSYKHIMHNGSAWTSATTIGAVEGQVGVGAVGAATVVSIGSDVIDVYYVQKSVGSDFGGSIYRRQRSAAGAWSAPSLILQKGVTGFSGPSTVVSGDADIRVVMTERAPSDNDSDAGGVRMYALGDGGMIPDTALVLDSDAANLINGFGVAPSLERKLAINDLITGLKAHSIWTKLDALYLMAAHDSAAARVNWKNPGTHNLSVGGGAPTFTTDSGYSTDGVDDYLDTNFNPATAGGNFTQNSASFGIWSSTSGGNNTSKAGWFDGTDGVTLNPRSAADTMVMRINQAATTTSGATVTNGTGFYAANRSASNSTQGYRNGASLVTDNDASTALNSVTLKLGNIAAATFGALGFRAAFIGGSLTGAEHSTLCSLIQEYLFQVGAETP